MSKLFVFFSKTIDYKVAEETFFDVLEENLNSYDEKQKNYNLFPTHYLDLVKKNNCFFIFHSAANLKQSKLFYFLITNIIGLIVEKDNSNVSVKFKSGIPLEFLIGFILGIVVFILVSLYINNFIIAPIIVFCGFLFLIIRSHIDLNIFIKEISIKIEKKY